MDAYTIAVINFNGIEVLPATLEALSRIPDPGLRIMVLDNGSTDGSREWVAKHYPQLDLRHTALPRRRPDCAASLRALTAPPPAPMFAAMEFAFAIAATTTTTRFGGPPGWRAG